MPPPPPFIAFMKPLGAWPVFDAMVGASAAGRRLWFLPFSFRTYPEAREVAEKALETFLATARKAHWSHWLPRALALWLIERRYAGLRRMWERSPGAVGLCWNGFDRERYLFAESARRAGRDCLFAELAPLPGFLTLDPRGVNFAGSVPQSPDFYHAWASRNPGRHDWKAVVGRLVARAPRKSPVASEARAVDGPFVFAPLQVPGDSQIRYFGDWLDSVEAMLRALLAASESLPQGWTLVIKEHPSSKVRLGHLIDPVLFPRCVLDNASDTFDLVRRSSAVVTINSSVGLQSFCLDKPVVVLGQAFFGFEPLVRRCRGLDELRRVLGSPESIGFDAELRDKFMSYLVGAYYFPWAKEAELDPEQLRRLSRLTRGERDA